jgi:hypothetical protein
MVHRVLRDCEGAVEAREWVLRFSEAVRGLTCDLALIYGEAVVLRDNGVAISERSLPRAAAL